MNTIFILSGYPCSGKTTISNDLAEYLRNHGRSVMQFARGKSNWDANMEVLSLTLYKWFSEKAEYLIIDAPAYTVFDRMDIFNVIKTELDRQGKEDQDILIISLNASRSMKFSFDHNQDPDHRPYTPKQMNSLINIYQQPIMAEGFDMVYRIDKNLRLNPEHLFTMIHNILKIDLGEDLMGTPEVPVNGDTAVAESAAPAEQATAEETV